MASTTCRAKSREWCSNASDGETDHSWAFIRTVRDTRFHETEYQPPIKRNPATRIPEHQAARTQNLSPRSWTHRHTPYRTGAARGSLIPSRWKTWLSFLSYTRSHYDAKVELTNDTARYWRMEKVSFDAAYAGERMVGYLYLPQVCARTGRRLGRGGGAVRSTSTENGQNVSDSRVWGYLVKDSRAVFYPVVKGTYRQGRCPGPRRASSRWTSRPLRAKDIFRSLDYLESRPDMREGTRRISRVELRHLSGRSTLRGGQTFHFQGRPSFKPAASRSRRARLVRRITIPVQMINGRLDTIFPPQTSQLPLFPCLRNSREGQTSFSWRRTTT